MKKYLNIIYIIIVLMMLSACGTDTSKDKGSNTQLSTGNNQKGDGEYYINLELIPEDAYDIFKDKYPNAKVKRIELDKESGSYVYEIEGLSNNMEYEVKINPFDGQIIKVDEDHDDDMLNNEIKREDLAKIPVLLKEAVEDVKDGYQLKDWNIEVDDDIVEIEIEFIGSGNKIEYKYNLRSGQLITTREKG